MIDLFTNVSFTSSAIALIGFVYLITSKSKIKAIKTANKYKSEEMGRASVTEIIDKLASEEMIINKKFEDGQLTFQKLETELNKSKEALKSIDVGLLPPVYSFDDSEFLKDKITALLEQQLSCIQSGEAVTMLSSWTWDGSSSKGNAMLAGYNYLTLKAFNTEFDVIRKQMRHSSFDTACNKLNRLQEQLSKLGETANVVVSYEYILLKVDELKVWHDELVRRENLKQERKAQQAVLRKQGSQNSDDSEDIEDNIYYKQSDLKKAQALAHKLHGKEHIKLKLEVQKLKKEILDLELKQQRATSQAQITKAGYIYVISNIGCFGEGVVKIGMTRRLEPMDRVNELGDASVAFKFDVHAMAFVDNAPSIEKTLHRKFHAKRVNTENNRKEFFKVSPQEVKEAMSQMDIHTDWFFEVEAKEYRESQQIRQLTENKMNNPSNTSELLPSSI
tara:strand:+ start:273 stop:1613 length:1341 start_codon:yes stop_codon:yes gene_type:complete